MKKFYCILFSVILFEILFIGMDVFFTNKYFSQSNNYINTNLIEIKNNRKNIDNKIEKIISLVSGNQERTEKYISKFNSQLTSTIETILNNADKQNNNLLNTILDTGNNNSKMIEQTHLVLNRYINKVNNTDNSENKIVETDNLTQQLLSEGLTKYKYGEFTGAVGIYKKILDVDPSNTEALSYFNASLYYQNPGDGSNFSGIKNNLIPLLEGNTLSYDEKRTVLNVLIGMSMEEGDSASLEKYRNTLQKLKDNRK